MAYRSLIVTVEPAALAVDLTACKAWLRVDHDDDDTIITDLIKAATEAVQYETRIQPINCTRRLGLKEWKQEIQLPFSPLSSVTTVEYRQATDGQWTTWNSSNYEVVTATRPGLVRLNAQTWPDLYEDNGEDLPERIRITYVSGYGSAYSNVPADIRTAIMARVSTMYTHRELLSDVAGLKEINGVYAPLTANKRVLRF